MSPLEAKKILLLRRGPADDADPEVAEALAVAKRDPELRQWLESQAQFHESVRERLREIPVPPGLMRRILAHAPAPRLTWWRRFPVWAAAAAAVILYLGLSLWWRSEDGDSFPIFRSRMVRSVLRQYQMDLETNNLAAIRQFLSGHQAPANFVLRNGLGQLPPIGAGLLSWQGQHVSMVCLDSRGKGTAILFVVDAASLKDPPPNEPVFARVSKLMTASWTTEGRAYLLIVNNPLIDQQALEGFL